MRPGMGGTAAEATSKNDCWNVWGRAVWCEKPHEKTHVAVQEHLKATRTHTKQQLAIPERAKTCKLALDKQALSRQKQTQTLALRKQRGCAHR